MINCGGAQFVLDSFTVSPDTKIYIIDSHRPLLLDNLTAHNNTVCVFDAESESTKMKPLIYAYEKLEVRKHA